MNKKTLIIVGVIVGLLVVGGGVFAFSNNQNNEDVAMEKTSEEVMIKDEEASMEKEEDVMVKDDTVSKDGSYVTLAEFDSDSSKYSDSKVVYFFHASWCPICKGIDEDFKSNTSQIPAGVTMVKTDFDNSTELRKKYGVTTQYTFVQVDSSGNETAQWSAASSSAAIEGIES